MPSLFRIAAWMWMNLCEGHLVAAIRWPNNVGVWNTKTITR